MRFLEDLIGAPEPGVGYNLATDPIYAGLFGAAGGGKGPSSVSGGPDMANSNRWEDFARRRAAERYGWGQGDFRFIDWIIGGGGPNDVVAESGWNPRAVNPSSGAYGIPQILPSAHPSTNLQSNPRGQVNWLLQYIRDRYSTPQEAYRFKSSHGWY